MGKIVLYVAIASLALLLADARAIDIPKDEKRPICSNLSQFPQSRIKMAEAKLLPPHFHDQSLSTGLRHLVDLATRGTQKQIRDETFYIISLENLDPKKLGRQNVTVSDEVLRVPEDLLTAQEIDSLQPQIQNLGFSQVLETSYQVPLLKTYPIPHIRLEGYTQVVAATADGYPVLLEHLPSGRRMEKLDDRANVCFVLAGLKILSSKGVLPTLLGVTKTEDGSLMAVFPLPAGYEAVQLTTLRVGVNIAMGLRSGKMPEPFEQENVRIQPFENLIERLQESQWPMQYFSLDIDFLTTSRPDLGVSQIMDLFTLPLWESQDPSGQEPFFYPNYFATGTSSWLPALFRSSVAPVGDIEVIGISKDNSIPLRDRLVHLPLQTIDPTSKFGRITLLRFEFFNSLLNGRAKVNYLNFLLEKSPSGQKALIEFIRYVAIPLKMDHLLAFLSSYQAKKYREAFRVVDGNL